MTLSISTAAARRMVISTLSTCVLATAFSQIAFAEAISDIGTWKLNIAKSSSSHDPMPKSNALTIQRVLHTNLLKGTAKGIDAEGMRIPGIADRCSD